MKGLLCINKNKLQLLFLNFIILLHLPDCKDCIPSLAYIQTMYRQFLVSLWSFTPAITSLHVPTAYLLHMIHIPLVVFYFNYCYSAVIRDPPFSHDQDTQCSDYSTSRFSLAVIISVSNSKSV